MKKFIFTVSCFTIVLLLYGLFFIDDDSQKSQPTNTLSVPASNKIASNKETIKEKIKTKKNVQPLKRNWLEGYDKETDHTPEVGLIQAFREFRKLKRCRVIIKAQTEGKDALQEFLALINNKSPPGFWKELTPIQQGQFNQWAISCLDLLEFDGELYTAAHERYRKRFYQTKAHTKIEKDFAKSWPYKVETNFIMFKYNVLINGYDTENTKVVSRIKRKIRTIKGMLGYININHDIDFSGRTQNEIAMYTKQLAELEGIVAGEIIVDDDYLVDAYQSFQHNYQKINTFLQQNKSSEAFMTLAPSMFVSQNIQLGFYDKNYFSTIINPVFHLFACSLDAPCSANSKTMVATCFNSRQTDEKACGKSVEEYFLDYRFSPNQLIDIDYLFNYFFENYAQN